MLWAIKRTGIACAVLTAASAAFGGGCFHGYGAYQPVYGGYYGCQGGYCAVPVYGYGPGYGYGNGAGYVNAGPAAPPQILDVCQEVGCSPRELYAIFQQHPHLVRQFPDFAKLLESQFGAFQPAPSAVAAAVVNAAASGAAPAAAQTFATSAAGAPAAPGNGAVSARPAAQPIATGTSAPAALTVSGAPPAPSVAPPAPSAAPPAPSVAPAVPARSGDLPNDIRDLLGAWINEDRSLPVSNIDLVDGKATITTQTADGPQKETLPFRLDVPTKTLFVTRDGQEVKFGTIVKADANRCELKTADGTRFVFVRPALM